MVPEPEAARVLLFLGIDVPPLYMMFRGSVLPAMTVPGVHSTGGGILFVSIFRLGPNILLVFREQYSCNSIVPPLTGLIDHTYFREQFSGSLRHPVQVISQ